MIKKIFICLSLILFLTNISHCQNGFSKTYAFQISKKLSPYVFKVFDITPKNAGSYFDKTFIIDIYKSDSTTLIQSIKYTIGTVWKELELNFRTDSSNVFLGEGNLLDVNFDGYKDLVLVSGIGAMGKNWCFDVYLFSVKDKKFHKSTKFSGFTNIELDPKKKIIKEHIDEGCASDCFTENTYKVINNKPIIINSLIQDFDFKKKKLIAYFEKYKKGIVVFKKSVKASGDFQ